MLSEKKYNVKKLVGLTYALYDIYFKRFKMSVRREEERQKYDNTKAKLETLNQQIKQQKENPTMPKGDIARLDDEKIRLEEDIKRYEANLKVYDEIIKGIPKSSEHPEGVPGLEDEIRNARDTVEIMKIYIKQIK